MSNWRTPTRDETRFDLLRSSNRRNLLAAAQAAGVQVPQGLTDVELRRWLSYTLTHAA